MSRNMKDQVPIKETEDAKENKDVKDLAEIFTKSLDDTQKNATDIKKLVQQVCDLSDLDSHKQVITGIIADQDTNWEEKIDLIQKANAEFDQREENNTRRVTNLQETQTQNVGATTSWWTENWRVVAAGTAALIFVTTPGGRKAISSAAKYLLTA